MPENRVQEALNVWLDYEKNLKPESMKAFECVPEMLQGLKSKDVKLALFTGRDRTSATKILKAHGWWNTLFPEALTVCGDDGIPTKPSPDAIVYLIQKMGVSASKVIMVGDHPHDMSAAKAAGVKSGAVLWDLPTTEKTHRANFKRIWDSWNSHDIDLRLVQPGSLLEWVKQR
jgi:phosphoglycolate phosphatase